MADGATKEEVTKALMYKSRNKDEEVMCPKCEVAISFVEANGMNVIQCPTCKAVVTERTLL